MLYILTFDSHWDMYACIASNPYTNTLAWKLRPCGFRKFENAYVRAILQYNCETVIRYFPVDSLRPRLNRRPFANDIFICIFLNENVWIPIKISLKFVPKGPINNIPALVQIMAWRRPGGKPLSEPMMVSLPTHICVARPQWVKYGCCWWSLA